MSKKPYQKKTKTKTVKIFGVTTKSVYFPPNTSLQDGLEILEDTLETVTAPAQMPL